MRHRKRPNWTCAVGRIRGDFFRALGVLLPAGLFAFACTDGEAKGDGSCPSRPNVCVAISLDEVNTTCGLHFVAMEERERGPQEEFEKLDGCVYTPAEPEITALSLTWWCSNVHNATTFNNYRESETEMQIEELSDLGDEALYAYHADSADKPQEVRIRRGQLLVSSDVDFDERADGTGLNFEDSRSCLIDLAARLLELP